MTTIDVSGLFSLDGQVAVVTGASSGLGRRFARVLHGAGATVVVAARRADRLDELAAELGDRVVVVPADIADDDSVIALAEAAEAVAGHVDVLVNNAGVGGTTPAELETMERWRSTMAVNLDGLFLLSQQVGLGMIERGHGSIVNIASILGLVGSAPIKQAAYCASKGAVVNLTRELGAQWGRKGVRVNAIAPGWFMSEMTEQDMFGDDSSMEFIRRNAPMGR
ncbi:MAG TPA: SDR family NAD(P)-dependent oxidoreductase, partial [Microthrixaceae bacterium]|nr:SDR family NAD(P)-dependent oxidoreductase [Microthrixaceae bacterium]